ncbi:DNA damage-regulated autophagy modulator protein 1 isoform X2 [Callithrix jacchus]|uniref:DNA damage-regulated autophagy modulator protein 1 isoform X3 n=1 Tax=Callithrix jacchus TaxID=9483 RepID=UPI00159EEF84|nr:DNA damage-regulated autophagy modulator protein 1 isoform X3 [Callithrix jacchus]
MQELSFSQKVPAIQQKRTVAFLNQFVVHTVQFLNRFSTVCEEKLADLSLRIQQIETTLNILDAKGLNVTVVHDAGALLAFVCGSIYTLLQSIIFYESCPQWNSLWMCHIRMIISAVCCAAVVLMIVCASLVSTTKLEWDPSEKDYVYHVVSAICEWTVAFSFIFYFLTFIQDFQLSKVLLLRGLHAIMYSSSKWIQKTLVLKFCHRISPCS